jgi:twinkle protein
MDITEIKQRLSDRAKSVAEYLLPNGKKEGNEWRAGDVHGSAGRSLGVHLEGDKAGIWSDFATGEGGDLLDLWAAARGVTLAEAITEAKAWLGIETPKPYREPKKDYDRPPKPKCTVPNARVRDYLTEDRNIPLASVNAYKVGERGDMIVFPFLLPDGTLALVKERRAVDKADPVPTAKNCEPALFGWQAVPDGAREVVITEGEIDALSWHAYGRPALSVPSGGGAGGKQKWIENEFERVARFERIYISTDMDEEGEKAAAEIAQRLGRHRCFRVKLPHKDANDCLVEGVARAEMDAAIENAASLDPEGLRRASDYTSSVLHLFWPAEGEFIGYQTPYRKLEGKLLFRPGEATLWSGSSGAGKSQILSDCTVDWVKQGSRVCVVSLEMKPAQLLKRKVKQVVGADRPSTDFIRRAIEWLDTGLLIYDNVGKADVKSLLEVFDYARARYGCDQFIIDSLMRLGVAGDDYTGQERTVFTLVDWTVKHDIHLHLVAHSRKGGAGDGAPATEDIKGAMEIGANAFNILTVWRNRELEDDLRKAEQAENEDEAERLREKPGVIVNVAKQRNGDYEGKVGLWFDQDTYRYRSSHDGRTSSRQYLPNEPQAA